MKIIAVNINKQLAKGTSPIIATERAWKLNLHKCKDFEFVIGVVNSKIIACFRKINVRPDIEHLRVCFDLIPCRDNEIIVIENYISSNHLNLKGIVTKYIS